MKNINYRATVNTTDSKMNLGFYGLFPGKLDGEKIRLQAVFSQKAIDRRIPMDVSCGKTDNHTQIIGVAVIDLPFVFYTSPRRSVEVTFSLWYGTEEIILDSQPVPLERELFARPEEVEKKNTLAFVGCTLALPVLLPKYYVKQGKDMKKAKKDLNEKIYRLTGRSYSPRQEHTDFFASTYHKLVSQRKGPEGNTLLFLSERRPEKNGNLMLLKRLFEKHEEVTVTEFINTKTVDLLSKEELKECAEKCAKARVIILEDFYPQLHKLHIQRDTKVVQLWHACGAFKTFGFSRMGLPGGVSQDSMNHRNYDLVCVSSEAVRGIYAEAFGVPTSKVQALGVPRTDVMYNWEYKLNKRNALYKKFPDWKEGKIVLYAPTFRGDGNKDAHFPMEKFSIDEFMEKMPEEVILVIKHHPFVKQEVAIPEKWKDRVFDLSQYDNVNDLLLVTDLLITDYSSSVFEAALLEVPMMLYAFDEKEYIGSRDFYFSLDRFAVGPIAHSFREMTDAVSKYFEGRNREAFLSTEKTERFRQDFLSALDGSSTMKIYEYIKENFLLKK